MTDEERQDLNSVVTEYAMSAMGEYALTCEQFQPVLQRYHRPLNNGWQKCEAEVRTLGLSRPYVVASCIAEGDGVCFSDYSGKKNRQAVIDEFPDRKDFFRNWYRNNQKPYQHKVLYDHITTTLGTIGNIIANVNHPVGYCAEQNVANRLMLATDRQIEDIYFSIAIRPKTGQVVAYCNNCKALFEQLNDAED